MENLNSNKDGLMETIKSSASTLGRKLGIVGAMGYGANLGKKVFNLADKRGWTSCSCLKGDSGSPDTINVSDTAASDAAHVAEEVADVAEES